MNKLFYLFTHNGLILSIRNPNRRNVKVTKTHVINSIKHFLAFLAIPLCFIEGTDAPV